MDRDLELIEWLDHLGYDEAWIGEHHSAGWEIIAAARDLHRRGPAAHPPYPARLRRHLPALSPPAAGGAALRAAGPYEPGTHHAGLRAGRADHRRLHDGHQADRPAPAHDRGAGRHRRAAGLRRAGGRWETDWFTLREARLHLAPWTEGRFPIAVASTITPFGMMAAGRHGLGVLSIGAGHSGRTGNAGEAMADRRRRGREAWQDHGPPRLARGGQHASRGGTTRRRCGR